MAWERLGMIIEAWVASLTPLEEGESNMFTMCYALCAIALLRYTYMAFVQAYLRAYVLISLSETPNGLVELW